MKPLRYRPHVASRVAFLGIGALFPGAYLVAAARESELHLLPVVALVAVVSLSIAIWVERSTGVTLTADGVIVGIPLNRTTIPWPELSAIDPRGPVLWLMSADGWYRLPVPTRCTPVGGGLRLGEAVWHEWHLRRGADWRPTSLAPWTPPRDLRGRAVIRRRPHRKVLYALGMYASFAAQAAVTAIQGLGGPNRSVEVQLQGHVCGLVLLVGILAVHHAWARATVDDHRVVVRSLTGVSRFPIVTISGVDERPTLDGQGLVVHQLLASVGPHQPAVARGAPLPVVAGGTSFTNDPEFFAKWAWLHEHLVVGHTDLSRLQAELG
jgi:hypothetical protein